MTSGYAELSDTVRVERTRTTTILAKNSGSDQYPWGIHHYTELVTYIANDETPANSSVLSTYTTSIEQKDRVLKWSFLSDQPTRSWRRPLACVFAILLIAATWTAEKRVLETNTGQKL